MAKALRSRSGKSRPKSKASRVINTISKKLGKFYEPHIEKNYRAYDSPQDMYNAGKTLSSSMWLMPDGSMIDVIDHHAVVMYSRKPSMNIINEFMKDKKALRVSWFLEHKGGVGIEGIHKPTMEQKKSLAQMISISKRVHPSKQIHVSVDRNNIGGQNINFFEKTSIKPSDIHDIVDDVWK